MRKPKPTPELAPTKADLMAQAQALPATPDQTELERLANFALIKSAGREPDGKRAAFKSRVRKVGHPKGTPQHPNAQAALDLHRWGTVFGGPNRPPKIPCDWVRGKTTGNPVQCKDWRVKGSRFCYRHGGRKVIEARLRATYLDYKPDRAVLGMALLRQIVRSGRFPMDVHNAVPAFAECYLRARRGVAATDPKFAHMDYGQRRAHHEACVTLMLGWIGAYSARVQRGDWGPWTECVRTANALGL